MEKRVTIYHVHALLFSLAVGLCFVGSASAQEEQPKDITPNWVLRADRLLDVDSGEMLHDMAIVVVGETISWVGAASDLREEWSKEMLDLGDVTLLPGLMDLHTHLTVGSRLPRSARRGFFVDGPIDIAYRAEDNARATLQAGFTTVREAGAVEFIDSGLKRAMERGFVSGPRIVPSGYQISITGGHGDELGWQPGLFEYGPEHGIGDGVPSVLKAVRYQIKHGAEVIKVTATAGVSSPEATADARQFSDEELAAIVDEAKRQRVRVLAHAHGLEGIRAAVLAGVDSIEHGSQIDRQTALLMKERGTYLVPTAWINAEDGANDGSWDEWAATKGKMIMAQAKVSLRIAIDEGVPIAYGTDSGVYPHGLNGVEMGALVRAGMTPLAAIRSATLNAAVLLGVDDRGAIREGLLADLIAVPDNPLDDVSVVEKVRFVMKGGVVYRCGDSPSPHEGWTAEQMIRLRCMDHRS